MTDDAEFKEKLNPEQYRVMRQRDTERPYSGKYWDHDETGLYSCAFCGTVLFSSHAKLESERGWPRFKAPMDDQSVVLVKGERTEIECAKCRSHIGHLEVQDAGGGAFYEVNSAALDFQEMPDLEDLEDLEDDGSDDQTKQENEKRTLQNQLRTALIMLAAALVGAGVGYASGTAVCRSSRPANGAIPTQTAAPSPLSNQSPLSTPAPTPKPTPKVTGSPTPSSTPSAAPVATPTLTPMPTPTPTPSSTPTATAASSGGSVPTP